LIHFLYSHPLSVRNTQKWVLKSTSYFTRMEQSMKRFGSAISVTTEGRCDLASLWPPPSSVNLLKDSECSAINCCYHPAICNFVFLLQIQCLPFSWPLQSSRKSQKLDLTSILLKRTTMIPKTACSFFLNLETQKNMLHKKVRLW